MSEDIFMMKKDRVTSYIAFTFANCCMPTLMKTKPSSLVSFHKRYISNIQSFLIIIAEELKQFECKYEILYENETTYYFLIYNPELLKEIIGINSNNLILKENGYIEGDGYLDFNIMKFKMRYENFKINNTEFPHEVGVFLGYPIIDVEEYIKNKGENFKLCGYWKVYHNVDEAWKTFQLFNNLRTEAIELFYSGRDLCEITL